MTDSLTAPAAPDRASLLAALLDAGRMAYEWTLREAAIRAELDSLPTQEARDG